MKKYLLLQNNLKKNIIFYYKNFLMMLKYFINNDEYDLDELIDGKKQVCVIFDDLIKDNNYINEWFVRISKEKLL